MPGATTGHQNVVGIGDSGAGKATTRQEHRGKAFPREIVEIETESGRSRRGTINRKGSCVEERSSDYIEMMSDWNGGEVTEAIDMGITGQKGKRAPRKGEWVKEKRGNYGGVLGENTEKKRDDEGVK